MEKRAEYLAPVRDVADELATVNTWITVPEIAVAIGRSATTVRGLLAADIIPGRRKGSRWYVQRASFMRWLSEGGLSAPQQATKNGQGTFDLGKVLEQLLSGDVKIVITFEPLGQARRF